MIKKMIYRTMLTTGANVAISIDPLDAFNAPSGAIVDAVGVLLPWGLDALATNDPIQAMTNYYGFGTLHRMTGGTVAESGAYQYPSDPDLAPLVTVYLNEKPAIHFYECAIVHFVSQNFTTRMD